MAFTKNEGSIDRLLRIALGLAAIYVGWIVLPLTPAIVAVLAGTVLLITGVSGTCPLYAAFGLSTCRRRTP